VLNTVLNAEEADDICLHKADCIDENLRLQFCQFDIEHLPGARMPAEFLSRIVDKADSTAPDLEDDSHLVFALTSDGVSQQDTTQIVRPSGNPDRKRRTRITGVSETIRKPPLVKS